jgi:hypothetical protein
MENGDSIALGFEAFEDATYELDSTGWAQNDPILEYLTDIEALGDESYQTNRSSGDLTGTVEDRLVELELYDSDRVEWLESMSENVPSELDDPILVFDLEMVTDKSACEAELHGFSVGNTCLLGTATLADERAGTAALHPSANDPAGDALRSLCATQPMPALPGLVTGLLFLLTRRRRSSR